MRFRYLFFLAALLALLMLSFFLAIADVQAGVMPDGTSAIARDQVSPSPTLTVTVTPSPRRLGIDYIPTDFPGSTPSDDWRPPQTPAPPSQCTPQNGCEVVCSPAFCSGGWMTPVPPDWGEWYIGKPTATPYPISVTLHFTPASHLGNWSCVVTSSIPAYSFPVQVARCLSVTDRAVWCDRSGAVQYVGDSQGLNWWRTGDWPYPPPRYAVAVGFTRALECSTDDIGDCAVSVDNSGVPGHPAGDVEFALFSWHAYSGTITDDSVRYWNVVHGVRVDCARQGWGSITWTQLSEIWYWGLEGYALPPVPPEPPADDGGGWGVIPVITGTFEITDCAALTDCCRCVFSSIIVTPVISATRCYQLGPFDVSLLTGFVDAFFDWLGLDVPALPASIIGFRVCIIPVQLFIQQHPLLTVLFYLIAAFAMLFATAIALRLIRRG